MQPPRDREDHIDVTGKFPGGEVNVKGRSDRVLLIFLILASGVASFIQHHQMTQATERLTCILSMDQGSRAPALNSGDPCAWFYWMQRTPPGTADIRPPGSPK